MKHDRLAHDVQMEIKILGKSYWVPSIPTPFFTTKGLPFWKRLNEKNWRPQCACGQIFDSMDDYNAHVTYWSSAYGLAVMEERKYSDVKNA